MPGPALRLPYHPGTAPELRVVNGAGALVEDEIPVTFGAEATSVAVSDALADAPAADGLYSVEVLLDGAVTWTLWVYLKTTDTSGVLALEESQTQALFARGVLTVPASGNWATSSQATAIEADTQDIQTRLPAALVGGRMDSSVGAMEANTLTSAALASDAVTEIQSGLATSSEVTGLNVNTRANISVPVEFELPDSSTQVYKIRLTLFDMLGNMEAPDSTPTIALVNAAGTDRSSRLSSASNPSTGVYSWDYTATAGDAEEQLLWTFTVVEGGLTRTYPATSYVVEETAYRFSSSDRAKLTTLHDDWADGGRLDVILDSRSAQATLAGLVTTVGAAGAGLTALPWNAAWDAEIESEAADALTAYGGPTNAQMEARTLPAASYATSANQATILARLGGWAGTARNSILGAFQALFRKDADATVPSDINANLGGGAGAADNTTDSTQAIRDQLAGAVRTELTAELENLDAPVSAAVDAATDAETAAGAAATAAGAAALAAAAAEEEAEAAREVTDKLDSMLELDGPAYRFTEPALALAPAGEGGDPSDEPVRAIVIDFTSHAKAQLAGQSVRFSTPTLTNEMTITPPLVEGDDYSADDDRRVLAEVENWEGRALDGEDVELRLVMVCKSSTKTINWEADAVVAGEEAGAYSIYFAPTSEETADYAGDWFGQVVALFDDDTKETPVPEVSLRIRKAVEIPAAG